MRKPGLSLVRRGVGYLKIRERNGFICLQRWEWKKSERKKKSEKSENSEVKMRFSWKISPKKTSWSCCVFWVWDDNWFLFSISSSSILHTWEMGTKSINCKTFSWSNFSRFTFLTYVLSIIPSVKLYDLWDYHGLLQKRD